MTTRTGRVAKKGKRAAKRLYQRLETKMLALEGRRSVRAKGRKLGRVGRQVAEAGLLIGAVVALELVLDRLSKEHGRR
jgi:uncharacterized Zn-binding protein involved in type VI secretion